MTAVHPTTPRQCRSTRLWSAAFSVSSLTLTLGLVGCLESRVVRYDPPLGDLPGAQSSTPIVRDDKGRYDPTYVKDNQIVIEDKSGHKTLISKAPRHLMSHILMTLDKGEKALFTEQVLSEHIKNMYNVRGEPADGAFDILLERRQDIQALFDAMPMAENTPGVYVKYLQPGMMRIQVTGVRAEDLTWTSIDMIQERGNWRLVWFGNEPIPNRPQ